MGVSVVCGELFFHAWSNLAVALRFILALAFPNLGALVLAGLLEDTLRFERRRRGHKRTCNANRVERQAEQAATTQSQFLDFRAAQ